MTEASCLSRSTSLIHCFTDCTPAKKSVIPIAIGILVTLGGAFLLISSAGIVAGLGHLEVKIIGSIALSGGVVAMVGGCISWHCHSKTNVPTAPDQVESLPSANEYYDYIPAERGEIPLSEYDDQDQLAKWIKADNLEALKNSCLIQQYGISHPYGRLQETLLHIAYSYNKPKIVAWLLENGASERVCNYRGQVPAMYAHKKYRDTQPRVINEIVSLYVSKAGVGSKDPHVLYDILLKFITQKKWRYNDNENRTEKPFRDGRKLYIFGAPNLSYYVNCSDLCELFYETTKILEIEANPETYHSYRSIHFREKEGKGIEGNFSLFDGSVSAPFSFDMHMVIYSMGYFFDLTLMCKYREKNAVLAQQDHSKK